MCLLGYFLCSYSSNGGVYIPPEVGYHDGRENDGVKDHVSQIVKITAVLLHFFVHY